MRNIKNYIYIDEQGIDSIYSQLHDETVDKMTVKQTKSKAASVGITAGLSKFKQLFTADASANGELSKSTQYEKSVSLTYEQKITRIIDTVSKYDNYYTDLNIATNSKNLANDITFVNVSDTFFSRLNFTSYEVFEYIQKSGYIEFEKGDMPISPDTKITYNVPYDSYNYHDSYYKDSRYRVVLSMSIDKMRTSYRGMTSHLAVALRGCEGKINLGVFGQLRVINDLYFQIKPFAVWW